MEKTKQRGQYDETLRGIFDLHVEDWIVRFGVPHGTPVKVPDSDVSSVSARADKVLLIGAETPYVMQVEFQAGHDDHLIRRMLRYNALLHELHKILVVSALILLHRKADGPAYSGQLSYGAPDHAGSLDFRYQIVRIWELDVDELLAGGPGLQTLAVLSDSAAKDPRGVVLKLVANLKHHRDWKRIKEWASALAAMRYTVGQVNQMFEGADEMVTFDEVLEMSSIKSLVIDKAEKRGMKKGTEAERKRNIEIAQNALLRLGDKLLGTPTAAQTMRIALITDAQVLADLQVLVLKAGTWDELLSTLRELP